MGPLNEEITYPVKSCSTEVKIEQVVVITCHGTANITLSHMLKVLFKNDTKASNIS